MRNDNNLFFLALIPIVSILLHRLSLRKSAKNVARNEASYPPITVKTLYRIALWPYIHRLLFVLVPAAALFAAACLFRRMALISALASFLLISAFVLMICFPLLQSLCSPLAVLRKIPNFNEIFSGKQLYWLNGAWGYADDEWFIRVGSKHSVILHAAGINFQCPVRKLVFKWHTPSFKGSSGTIISICKLCFTGHDGKTITACTWADQNIVNWILRHGGSMAEE